MPLAQTVEAHQRLQYQNSVTLVAQQMKDPFEGVVTDVSGDGRALSASDLFCAVEYTYGVDRSRQNPDNHVKGDRRWLVRPPVIESGQYIDPEDKLDNIIDPTSSYVTLHTAAVMRGKADRTLGIRKKDDGSFEVIDGGILGYATSGKDPNAQVALPAGQYVPVGATGLTLDKLRDAKLALNKADFGLEDDDAMVCMITPQQVDDLLGIAAASGTALNAFNIEQLRTGKPTTLLGYTWKVTNRLPKNAAGSRLCPLFSKKNIIRGIWQDVQGDLWNDTHAKNRPVCLVDAYIDCVRLQDKAVIVIECAE